MKGRRSSVSKPKTKPNTRAHDRLSSTKKLFPIAGIGASAGGLEAFKQLLQHIPGDIGMGYVLVQHLAPKYESALTELLSRFTTLPVTEVKDGMAVEPNHVYVIPPNTDMAIFKGILRLTPRSAGPRKHMPIDEFLHSLATDRGARAIGVILSGTGSDGTLGMKAIKAEGGITFAQDAGSASYPEMPRSAVSADCVDFILSPEGIAHELERIGRHPYITQASPIVSQASSPKGDEGLDETLVLLRNHSGVNFALYKQTTIKRRVWRRMALHKIHSPREYANFLQAHPDEISALYHDILIHVTGFFRDPGTFEALKENVLPAITAGRDDGSPVRIWVPGCSTGEEVYSIVIALLEFLGDRAPRVPVQVFASDISEMVLNRARAGIFLENIAADVSPRRLRKFFAKSDHGFQISKAIREMCVFAKHDVTRDPPFSKLDLISCRNVLIYLDPILQKKVLPFFEYALKPGGFLLLGTAEDIGNSSEHFTLVDKKNKIYSRKISASPPAFRLTTGSLLPARERGGKRKGDLPTGVDVQKEVDRVLLGKYTPAGIVVNSDLEILQFRGRTGPFLEPSPGQPSLSLPKMAREGLMADLRVVIHKAQKEGKAVRKEGVQFNSDGGKMVNTSIEAVPIQGPSAGDRYCLVLFEEIPPLPPVVSKRAKTSRERQQKAVEAREIPRLKADLAQTRASLQSIIEEQEATNEELRSANEEILSGNEELQSTNEELETAKEELQSANEELTTVNEELQNRNQELSASNSDLINLLSTVQIPIIMVGGDLCIRHSTPAAERIFNIIPSDMGRPIGHLRPSVDIPDMEALITDSISTISNRDREVQDRDGRWYSLRVRPYQAPDNRIDGAVLMLLDIDALKSEVNETRNYAEAIVETVKTPFMILDGELKVKAANRAFYASFHVSSAATDNRLIYDLGNGQWDIPRLRELLEEILPKETQIANFVVDHDFPGIGQKTMLLNARAISQRHTPGHLILLSIEDVTERTRAVESLRKSQAMFEKLFEGAPDALLTSGKDGRIARVNLQVEKLFGYGREELLGQPVEILVPDRFKNAHPGHRQDYHAEPRMRPMGAGLELYGRRKDGFEFPVDVMLSPLETDEGAQVLAVVRDISDRKRAEEALRESEQQLYSILSSSPSVIFVKDVGGRYIFTNPQFQKLAPLPVTEIVGKTDGEIFPPDQAEAFRANDAKVLEAGQPVSVEEKATHADGVHTSIVTKFPLRDTKGQIYGICGIVTDITERTRAEEALRLLVEVTAAASEAEDVRTLTARSLEAFCRVGGWQVGQAWFLDERQNLLRCDSRAVYTQITIPEFRQASLQMTFKEGQGLIGQVWKSKEPIWLAEFAALPGKTKFVRSSAALKEGLQSLLAMPIWGDKRFHAVWEFYSSVKRPQDSRFLEVARRLGNHLAIVYERKLAEKSLADLSVRLMKLQDEEGRRIARNLHDSTAQMLSAAAMNLSAVSGEFSALSPRAANLVAESESLLGEASNEIRTIAHLLHPQALDQVGLATALRGFVDGFANRSGIRVELELPESSDRLPQEIEIALFRIVQESLSNVHRHARADSAKVCITADSSEITLEVIDHRKDTSASRPDTPTGQHDPSGLGITGMRERVKELGGQFNIMFGKRGTTVRATLPLGKGTT